MLSPLVHMLADPAERCRELSIAIITESLARLPEPAILLAAAMPALAARLGSSPVQVWHGRFVLASQAAALATDTFVLHLHLQSFWIAPAQGNVNIPVLMFTLPEADSDH